MSTRRRDVEPLKAHARLRGKVGIYSKIRLRSRADLTCYYTPGVGEVARRIFERPGEVNRYTMRGNAVAVITDGSAVLGLGNVGPWAALPVMEGKCLLFKELADIDAVPLVLDTQDIDEVVRAIEAISPGFAAINLEDIKAPACFEIERRLRSRLSIPVVHDDQHATAIVVLAAAYNALRVVGKRLEDISIVISGAGAAGSAIVKLLHRAGARNMIVADSKGIIHKHRKPLEPYKRELVRLTNSRNLTGLLENALEGADLFIGVSRGNILTREDIARMARGAIVFALANPNPELLPREALAGGAAVVATGRSDFPNQVNNILAFPGVFRGALDHTVAQLTDEMKLRAARALSRVVARPTRNRILPSPLDKQAVRAVASAVR